MTQGVYQGLHRNPRRGFSTDVASFRARWRSRSDDAGITYVPVDTGRSYVESVHAMLNERELRR